jgi:hypothetical protein
VEGGLTRAVIVSRLIDASDSIRWVEELEPEIEVARARLDEARAGPSGLRLSRALTQSRIRRLSRGLGSMERRREGIEQAMRETFKSALHLIEDLD